MRGGGLVVRTELKQLTFSVATATWWPIKSWGENVVLVAEKRSSDIQDIDSEFPFPFEIFNNLFNHHHNKSSCCGPSCCFLRQETLFHIVSLHPDV